MFFGFRIFDIIKIIIRIIGFDSEFYRSLIGVDRPFRHFFKHGYWENRPINKKNYSKQTYRELNSVELLDEIDMIYFQENFSTTNCRLPNLYFENLLFFHELRKLSKIFSSNLVLKRESSALIINFGDPIYFRSMRKNNLIGASIFLNIISDDSRYSRALDNLCSRLFRNTFDLHFNFAFSESIINMFRFTLIKAKVEGKFNGDIYFVGDVSQCDDPNFFYSLIQESTLFFRNYGITIRDSVK